MLHDVVLARHLGGYRIELTFDDGKSGVVDLSTYLDRGGVFLRFMDPEYFRSFRVDRELGTLTWNEEVDIAPESLYSLATGEPLPEWVEPRPEVGTGVPGPPDCPG
jgi:hypothetical protein